jgi:hypothetical protein
VCSTLLTRKAYTCHPHTLSSDSPGRPLTDVLERWQTASAARWVFRCNHSPYAAARIPCTRSHFNSTQLAPVVHRGRRAAWRCQHAPCTKSPPITRDDLPRRLLNGLGECTAPPLVQRRVPQEIPHWFESGWGDVRCLFAPLSTPPCAGRQGLFNEPSYAPIHPRTATLRPFKYFAPNRHPVCGV